MGFYVAHMLLSDFTPNWSIFPNLSKTPNYQIQCKSLWSLGCLACLGAQTLILLHTLQNQNMPKNVSFIYFVVINESDVMLVGQLSVVSQAR